jgi:hypothetical protein
MNAEKLLKLGRSLVFGAKRSNASAILAS